MGFHGPHVSWNDAHYGEAAAESTRRALMEPEVQIVRQDTRDLTAEVLVVVGLPIGHGRHPGTIPLAEPRAVIA